MAKQRVTPLAPAIVGAHLNATLSGVQTLTPPAGANALIVQVFVQNVRYTLDGTTPSASIGFQWPAGLSERVLDISSTMTIKVIGEAAGAIIQYQWGFF